MGVSIHAPRVGCDPEATQTKNANKCFNSRTPCGVRLIHLPILFICTSFNSRTPCGVRLRLGPRQSGRQRVSIHAPRVGCDHLAPAVHTDFKLVSIHAPRVGCDHNDIHHTSGHTRFNSRTPCGVRLFCLYRLSWLCLVSIHAPRVGCDTRTTPEDRPWRFQFTHPVWGATDRDAELTQFSEVSIHAPRVGCDQV